MIPQLRAMYNGDRSRKQSLVDYGFRLPSALDNRPLQFEEWMGLVKQVVFVSATPSEFERNLSGGVSAEQVIRPTGLIDPIVEVRKTKGQIDDLIGAINEVTAREEKVLVTTLTKKMAESLTDYLAKAGIRVRYLHSDIQTFERMEIIRDMRMGVFDVLVGINLLREGLDIPEVSLVTILDADKQGFLRNETSLVQTIGRAARNVNGKVILYADVISPSMERAMAETERRRAIQTKYNEDNNITPTTIKKSVREMARATMVAEATDEYYEARTAKEMTQKERMDYVKKLQKEMQSAAKNLEFERAAVLRDRMLDFKLTL
jgi:excinuclease ABC subunit B